MSTLLLDLPEDVLTCILFKLPARTISRVIRRLNKYFYHLTWTHEFIKAYSKLIVRNVHGVITQYPVSSHDISNYLSHPVSHSDDYTTVGSCNGLICTTIQDGDDNNKNNRGGCLSLMLWHPEFEVLLCPLDPTHYRPRFMHISSMKFCFQDYPRYIRTTFGFGYDETSGDYKVVAFCLYFTGGHIPFSSVVLVCSSKRNSWRRVHDTYPGGVVHEHSSCFASGKIHWITDPETYESKYPRKDIVSFDVEKETFGSVQEPHYGTKFLGTNPSKTISVVEGCLSLMSYDWAAKTAKLWVMMDYGVKDSWTNLVTIKCPVPNVNLRFCSMLPNHTILLAFRTHFVVYNQIDDTPQVLRPAEYGLLVNQIDGTVEIIRKTASGLVISQIHHTWY